LAKLLEIRIIIIILTFIIRFIRFTVKAKHFYYSVLQIKRFFAYVHLPYFISTTTRTRFL